MTAQAHGALTLSQRIKQHWSEFKRSRPGHRFQERYRRRRTQGHSLIAKALSLLAGSALFIVGLVLLPAPGPGFLVILLGAGMIAEESNLAARALDAGELRLYRIGKRALRFWRGASVAQKALVVVLAAFAAVSLSLLSCALLFDI